MHLNRIGNRFQIQRAQIFNTAREKQFLMAHNFTRHFQNGFCALLETLCQPIGGLQRFADKAFFFLAFDFRGDFCGIGLIDEHARQRIRIELHHETAVGHAPHIDIGDHGLHRATAEFQSRFRIERADITDHIDDVFIIDTAEFS